MEHTFGIGMHLTKEEVIENIKKKQEVIDRITKHRKFW